MIRILLIYLLLACNGEQPSFRCPNNLPYKNSINKCSDFIDICVKKDDADCKNFQSACQQCPPSNYSIMMFIDILNVKNELVTTKSQLKNLTVQVQNQATKTSLVLSLLLAALIIIVIIIIILILEVRLKICTKLFHLKNRQYSYLSGKSTIKFDDKYHILSKTIKDFEESVEQNFNKQKIEIRQGISDLINSINSSTKFAIEDKVKPIEYKINTKDTVVKIKKELCDQFMKNKNYKIMKMKYNDSFLDDNEYFSNKCDSLNVTINCIFDTRIDPNDILVLKLRGNIDVPKYLQIDRNQTITDLKNILIKLKITKEIKIFKDSKELTNEFSLMEFRDYDFLYLINIELEKLKISSIFDKNNSIIISHNPVEVIENMKINIADQFNAKHENFVIFLENQYLDKNKYFFQYDMAYKADLQYCCFKRFTGIEESASIYKDLFYELFPAKDTQYKQILLKKYCFPAPNVKENKYILKELATFQITKSKDRFVRLLDVYKEKSNIYVVIENMEQGTMVNRLKEDKNLETTLISKWANKILEGLIFLHNKKIIYRAFSPSCILVDKDDNIKLHGLNLSKYTNIDKSSSLLEQYKKELPIRYLSPEILENKQYNELTDIWSFGAVLLFITTGEEPFPNIAIDEVNNKLDPNFKFKYEIPEKYKNSKLSEFIKSSLKHDPKERPSCSKLKTHDFIKNHNEN